MIREVATSELDYEHVRYLESGIYDQTFMGCKISPEKVPSVGRHLIYAVIKAKTNQEPINSNRVIVIDAIAGSEFKVLKSINGVK